MTFDWLVGVSTLLYLGVLFAVARFGDRRADSGRSVMNATVYALAIAVYCTSWTFYGSVGRATSGGFSFLTIYLGPTIMFLFAAVLLKMIRVSKALRLTSIADFVAARYGKSQFLAGLVTVIAVIGIIPYIALQLKAISYSLNILFPDDPQPFFPAALESLTFLPDSTAIIAMILAAFTIVFGTRHLDVTERHEGMVLAIAFESLFKLAAFIAVGVYVVWFLNDGFADIFARAEAIPKIADLLQPESINTTNWFSLTILSGLAVLVLPRQFQITVVENVDEAHMRRAVWLFPLYLLLINVFVLPIALSGMIQANGQPFQADTLVLTMPLGEGNAVMALIAFLGGLSAATGMVIVETIALATMVSNDLVMPILLRGKFDFANRKDLSGLIMLIRRCTIGVLLLLGYLYFRGAGEAYALVSIGLISFLAVAQFAPAMLGGLYWKEGNRQGALAGLGLGFAIWLYTALLPSFAKSGWINADFILDGPWGVSWLAAHHLFGLSTLDPISHTLFWSLLLNLGAYIVVSVLTQQHANEVATANQFVNINHGAVLAPKIWRGTASAEALIELLKRFLGPVQAQNRLQYYAMQQGMHKVSQLQADAEFVMFAETQLAGTIGSASAHVMVSSVVQEEELGLDEVLNILDEASQVRAHSRELERKSAELEAATGELRQANEKLREVDRLKDDFMSTVTHELRTPLTSIRAFSEMLHDDPDMAADDRTRFLGIIVGEAERLTRLINQILDFAKLESGRVEWAMERLDLCPLLIDTTESLTQLFRERGAVFVLELPEGERPVWVNVDRDRIKQVIINLLSNAVKFVPTVSGLVTISLQQQNGLVTLSVHDNGPGIPEAYQGVIFERFRQGGNTMTDKPQGTGLGLPISREIIEHFGGKLWVESTTGGVDPAGNAVASGATFSFTLPVAEESITGVTS
ncbi:MAG: ATP-binding protein [Fluviibacter sp.]